MSDGVQRLAELIAGRSWLALTGAGFSTDSGIPDYRGPASPPANPMLYADFVGDPANRRRYWVRSYYGWPRMRQVAANPGHRALAALGQASGLQGVITQNVDGLHTEAGSDPVLELHGRLAEVICLDCRASIDRAAFQRQLEALNPGLPELSVPAGEAELRPDGDLDIDDESGFVVPDCPRCAGILKPDVVFFGESVPKERVARAYAMVEAAQVLVVLGSSLTVMSGLRLVRYQAKRDLPVAIVNRGATRGDELATVRLEAGTTETILGLQELLETAVR
ncbi:NAD-dependent SIR2 family protein deacetylase [Naumannella halotolerans]|uniref:protein acetyllysine N-acetyltransferase n=1 Tax=Naumannella halotolerans TaxID=993414 RepID=A0A4R7JBU2_9ACTN|nr:NAD-dependent SIR2 family protein deacetylase [Naumannella halotolerans]